MEIITVKLKDNPYKIFIGYNSVKIVPSVIGELDLGNFGFIITSPKVYSLYKNLIKTTFKSISYKIIEAADGEQAKSKEWIFKTINRIITTDNWDKRIFIICLGGGTIGDMGGFIASIYKRGIPYIQIPTTLLSQIDASIGGKTAVDLKEAKNFIGTIYQPKAVFIDPVFLKTLSQKEMKEGIAEAIKYGVIADKNFFYFLKNNQSEIMYFNEECIERLISTCVKIKAKVVEKDEKEKKGLRTILNFGHTLAHALETALKYKKITHGEAVSLGMLYAAQLSYDLKICKEKEIEEINEIIKIFNLPVEIKGNFTTIYKAMSYDKKFISGKVRMVLLEKIGKVKVVNEIPWKNIKTSLKKYCIKFDK